MVCERDRKGSLFLLLVWRSERSRAFGVIVQQDMRKAIAINSSRIILCLWKRERVAFDGFYGARPAPEEDCSSVPLGRVLHHVSHSLSDKSRTWIIDRLSFIILTAQTTGKMDASG